MEFSRKPENGHWKFPVSPLPPCQGPVKGPGRAAEARLPPTNNASIAFWAGRNQIRFSPPRALDAGEDPQRLAGKQPAPMEILFAEAQA